MKFYLKFKAGRQALYKYMHAIALRMHPAWLDILIYKRIIMRVNLTIAFLIATLMQVSAEGYAQRITLSETNTSIKQIFAELNATNGLDFVYSPQMLNDAKPVNIDVEDATIEEVLETIFKDQPLTYTIEDNVVVVKRTSSAPSSPSIVKQQLISGLITDESGSPMPGVTILIKGSQQATSTDENGRYTISASPNDVLVVNMLGYKSIERSIGTSNTINFQLEMDVSVLRDVEVVSTGYQNLSRKFFTGASATLKAEDVKRDGIADVSRMLEGQVAGVSVQNVSGTFGAAPKIRIRGATSITGDNKPLWVIDGIILEDVVNISNEQLSTGDPSTLIGSSVAGLNPDDIASFEILKDASATALYGARAMNGVIVVTTKKGRKTDGKPVVSYTGNFSTYLKPTYSTFDILNSADQMSVFIEMKNKGFLNHAGASRSSEGGIFSKMYNQMYEYNPDTDSFTLRNDVGSEVDFLQRYAKANTNWFDLLFDNSLMQEHSVSLTSGSERSQFYGSTSFLHDNGWTIGDQVKRFTGNVRGTFQLNDRLSIELITQGSIRDQQAPGSQGRKSNPVTGEYDRDFDINPFSYALNTSRTMTAFDENGDLEYFTRYYAPFNIFNELEYNTMDLTMIDFKVQGGLKYDILDELRYSFDGAYRYAKTDQEHKIHENSNMPQAYRAGIFPEDATIRNANRFLYSNPDNPTALPVSVLPYGGFYNTESDGLVSYYMRHGVEWNHTFDEKHMVNVYSSAEMRFANRQNRFFDGYGYQFDRGGVPYIDPNIVKQNVEGNLNYYGMTYRYDRYLAYMGRAAYSYDGKYSLNATLRYDGSNLLGESRTARWLPTWNVSGAWNIDTEPFMQSQNVVSQATLRATYGLTASMGAASNSSLVLQNQSTRRPYLSEMETALLIAGLENSELTWEKQYETNIGADIGFLNNRITLTVDWYKRSSFDLIGAIRTSGIGGEEVKMANYADMESHGLEGTLGATAVRTSDWTWRTQFNFGYHVGEITKLENKPNIWSLIVQDGGPKEGYPYRGLFSIPFVGLDHDEGYPVFINEDGEESSEVYFQSDESQYLTYEGPVDPVFTGGFYNSVKFKNLSLSALVTFAQGNKVRLDPSFRNSYTDQSSMSKDFLNRWVMPGDEEWTNVPSIMDRYVASRVGSQNPYNSYNYSSVRVADGDFVRLKQVNLSYQLPSNAFKKLGVTNASLSLVANNLWLIYSDSRLNGQDPEFFGSGGVALPMPRQFTLSLKVGF